MLAATIPRWCLSCRGRRAFRQGVWADPRTFDLRGLCPTFVVHDTGLHALGWKRERTVDELVCCDLISAKTPLLQS